MVDEFYRIKSLFYGEDSIRAKEVIQLCERAIENTKQRVPVIAQRDNLEKENCTLRVEINELKTHPPAETASDISVKKNENNFTQTDLDKADFTQVSEALDKIRRSAKAIYHCLWHGNPTGVTNENGTADEEYMSVHCDIIEENCNVLLAALTKPKGVDVEELGGYVTDNWTVEQLSNALSQIASDNPESYLEQVCTAAAKHISRPAVDVEVIREWLKSHYVVSHGGEKGEGWNEAIDALLDYTDGLLTPDGRSLKSQGHLKGGEV